jgi:uncharacterized protein YndB with AHSA1/START domain
VTTEASDTIRWRLHLATSPQAVYTLLATDEGRARFWAESAREHDGFVEFRFPSGKVHRGRIVAREPARRFAVQYFGGTEVEFVLEDDGHGGTDLTLTERGVPASWREENRAGWVSVLLALKVAADFGVDVRSHDPRRTWDAGFVDN